MELKSKVLHFSSGSHGTDIVEATNILWDLPQTFWPRQWPWYQWSFTCFKLAKTQNRTKIITLDCFQSQNFILDLYQEYSAKIDPQMESTQDYYCSYFFKENNFQVHPINTHEMEKKNNKEEDKCTSLVWVLIFWKNVFIFNLKNAY